MHVFIARHKAKVVLVDRNSRPAQTLFNGIKGKVVRVEECVLDTVVGIQFIDISEEDKERIKKFVSIKQEEKKSKDILVQNDTIIYR